MARHLAVGFGVLLLAAALGASGAVVRADEPQVNPPARHLTDRANRLTYLDENNPYYVGREFPKLITPQWVGEPGVEAVVILGIDDMRGHEKWEAFLRPIIERLKQIDGRAPISIMTCTIDPQHPHLQTWLKEGLSLETHTVDHPCPLLKDGDFAKAKSTFDRCVDLLASVPGNRPVAFRMPCCDSLNTVSPRFFAEIFNKTTTPHPNPLPQGERESGTLPSPLGGEGPGVRGRNFLQIDSSVFNVFTPNDPELPRELVIDPDGQGKFLKYLPRDRSFVNYIEDYPYPYVINRLCWEFPCVTPSDWQAQHLHKPNNPDTVRDLKAALDATVIKQGVFCFVFHPHGWIRNDQIVELIDHAVEKHGRKVKFLTFRDSLSRLSNVASRPGLEQLEGSIRRRSGFQDGSVRWIDVNDDGFLDVLFAAGRNRTAQVWTPHSRSWNWITCPAVPARCMLFGVLRENQSASLLWSAGSVGAPEESGVWHFDGARSMRDEAMGNVPSVNGRPVLSCRRISGPQQKDPGARFRDVNRDGICELIVSNDYEGGQQAIFEWDRSARRWQRLPFALPAGTLIADAEGRDGGLRFIDLDEDGYDDVIFSNAERYSIHLFESMQAGWSREVIAGKRGERPPEREIPPFVRADGTDNGAWFHSRHLWWQNEDTAKLKDHVDRRSFNELLSGVEPRPKSPQASLQSIRTRPGFEVELVAAEPLVMDPIAFAWGPDGKFWVVEMGDYPLGTDGKGKHGGRVRFLEDTDGDGRYDRSTVFLDELGFPTGVMPWRNGVLITCAPEIFYAEDTDGDGRADRRVTLFSGFGEGNQQHRVNGLVWGLDNWIYCANGDSGGTIRSHVRADLPPVNINGRDFRIRPDTGEVDPQTGQTQFGRSRDDWGNWFGCNNANPMYQFVLPDHYTRRNPHAAPPDPRVPVSVTPGTAPVYPISRTLERFNDPNTANRFTSACSVIVYRDELFGPAFAGNSFVSEPVHNLIHREITPKKGTGVVSGNAGASGEGASQKRLPTPFSVTFTSQRAPDEERSEFLASSDNWFRPTTIATGPDGALWIADMYRYVIEHPEWIPKDWQARLDLRAGHDRGRIYRVYPVGQRPRPIPRLDKLDTAGLVGALDSPNGWQRDTAQEMLLWDAHKPEARARVIPLLERVASESERPLARLHALCTLDGLDGLRDEVLLRALGDSHPGVRRHAVRLCETRVQASPALADAWIQLSADRDAHVRLQLAFSLGEWSDARAGRALGRIALGDASDPFITAAVLSSAGKSLADLVAEVLAPGDTPPTELVPKLLGLAIAQNDAAVTARVLQRIVAKPPGGKVAPWQITAVSGLLDALDRRGSSLERLEQDAGEPLRGMNERLAELFAAARNVARDEQAPVADRLLGIRLLGRAADRRDDDLHTLAGLLTPQTAGELQEAAVAALGRVSADQVPAMLLDAWRGHGPKLRAAILDVLLSREAWTKALLDAIEAGRAPPGELDAARRQQLLAHKSPAIRERAATLFGGATSSSRQKVIDDYEPALKLKGDTDRGAAAYAKNCANCHRLRGKGQDVGPDLAALTDRSPRSLLVAVLDPNRAVEAKYINYAAATTDGRTLTGMLESETGNSITLLGQEGKREVILRTELEALQSTGQSLMPEGVERELGPQDVADLIAYLNSVGPPRKIFERNRPALVRPDPLRGELHLLAENCEIYGDTLVFEDKHGNLGYWSSANDHAVWRIDVARPGKYTVLLDWACDNGTAGNSFLIEVAGERLSGTVAGTGDWDTYKRTKIGELSIGTGEQRLVLRSNGKINGALIDLRSIRLVPPRD